MKLIITILLLALIGTNAFWAYVVIDQGVTQSYTQANSDLVQKQYEQTLVLANLQLIGLSSKEAIKRIGKDVYGLNPFIKEGCIVAGQVCIKLKDDKVVGIGN